MPVLDPEGARLAALRRLGDFAGRRVLEMGCGEGLWGAFIRFLWLGKPRAWR